MTDTKTKNVCRWLPDCTYSGNRQLLINDRLYQLRWENGKLAIYTFRDGTSHRYVLTNAGCMCPDAVNRRRKCKHYRAVAAAVARRPYYPYPF